jgi:CheY-like chemotaxis protein
MASLQWIMVAEGEERQGIQIKEVLEAALLQNHVHLVHNGDELLAYLKGKGIYEDRARFPLPRVLLLDLELPGRPVWEILQQIQSAPELRDLPVIAMVTPQTEKHLDKAYELGVLSYLRKPFTFADFLERSRLANLNFVIVGGGT